MSGRSANGKSADTQRWSPWFWKLKDPPVEKNIPHGHFKNAEGVCRMNFRGKPGLLLVEDAGAASKKEDPNETAFPCRYLLIPMPAL